MTTTPCSLIHGDATEEDVLERAGDRRAGVLATVMSDSLLISGGRAPRATSPTISCLFAPRVREVHSRSRELL